MKRIAIYLFAVVLASGCLDIKLEDQYSDPDAISTVQRARELLSSAYNSIPRIQVQLSVLSDDFIPTNLSGGYAEMLNLYNWQERAIDDFSSTVWMDYYMTVATLNALIPRLDNVQTEGAEDEAALACIRSEAYALKAFCYFDLLRLYGPVWTDDNMDKDGIILKDRLELQFLPRSSVKDCIDEIIRLLDAAADLENNATEVYYMGKDAISAIRAEVELWRGDYEAAISYGLPLLGDAASRWTQTDYDNMWSASDSRERLFAPYIFDTFYTDLCYDRESGDYYILNNDIVFEESDMREAWTVYPYTMAADTDNPRQIRNLGKYNRMYYESVDVRYINTIRYSGVCFTVAEAYARNNQESEAVSLMNTYLEARGVPAWDEADPDLTGDALIQAVLEEKRKEFVGEGTRWYDLKRLGGDLSRYSNFGNSVSSTIREGDYRWLLPIPRAEYRYNEAVTQNPDWPVIAVE